MAEKMEKSRIIRGMRLNNRYVVDEKIGSGGGGIVYRAYDENLQKIVVVKQIRDSIRSLDASRIEVDILKNIKHPHLPQVLDFFEDGCGEVYTVMEFIRGRGLDTVIAEQGRIEKSQALRWGEQLADVLSYLHSQKPPIIHSDIKPNNIIIDTETNDLCVIDFNISLALERNGQATIGATAGYSPPEQYGEALPQTVPQRTFPAPEMAGYGTEVLSRSEIFRDGLCPAAENRYESAELMGRIERMDGTERLQGVDAAVGTGLLNNGTGQPTGKRNTGSPSGSAALVCTGAWVDERSDVYSAGATLYHMLTGIRPPRDFSAIQSIRSFHLNLGEGLLVIIEKCLQLDPARRYASGKELFEAIRNIRELDADWRRYKRGERIRAACSVLLLVAGIGLTAGGQVMKRMEKAQTYQTNVDEAHALIQSDQTGDAQAMLQKAFAIDANRIDAYVEKALAEYKAGEYETAVRTAADFLNRPGRSAGAKEKQAQGDLYYILGNAYFELGQYDDANVSFRYALDCNPENNSLFYRDYAVSLAKSGNTGEAEKQLEQAVEHNLSGDAIRMAEAEILFSTGDYSGAVQAFEEAFRASTDTAEKLRIILLCDQAYQALGNDRTEDQIRFLTDADAVLGSASTVHVRELLAQAWLRKAAEGGAAEDYRQAAAIYQGIRDAGYATANTLLNLGIIYEKTDDYENAGTVFHEYTERYPDDYQGYMYLAFLEAMLQQTRENRSRSYRQMNEYYQKARNLYEASGAQGDQNMEQLERLIEDAKRQGWL